jgi:hypothetical protein
METSKGQLMNDSNQTSANQIEAEDTASAIPALMAWPGGRIHV